MSTGRPSLPEYAHPPLVAATLSVVWRTVSATAIEETSLKEFQRQLGPEWIGDWSDVPSGDWQERMDFGFLARGRQLKNVLGDRVLRISPDHLGFTWLGTKDGRYPRYETVRDGFVSVWDHWCALPQRPFSSLRKWGVTYLNRIPQGTVWHTPHDWSFIKLIPPDLGGLAGRLSAAQWQIEVPGVADGLAVNWTRDLHPVEGDEPCLWLRLNAVGDVGASATALLDGMDAGRAAIVQTFSDLLSPAANAYWGLRRREK